MSLRRSYAKTSTNEHLLPLPDGLNPLLVRFILRDFTYSSTAIQKASDDFSLAETTERELWTELLRLSRTNFSEAFQVLVHLKVIRLFVESVLRYGLPAEYVGVVIKVSHFPSM